MAKKTSSETHYIQQWTRDKIFSPNTIFRGESGHLFPQYRPMLIGTKDGKEFRIGKNNNARLINLPASYNYGRSIKNKANGQLRTRDKWGAFAGRVALKPNDWARQLFIAAHQIELIKENWPVVVTKRAENVFVQSFELKRFNSAGSKPWKHNKWSTWKKRKKRGTWEGDQRNNANLMVEYGKLKNSFEITKRPFGMALTATAPYARIHNAPEEEGYTYGTLFGAQKVSRRQFMGHSTKIDAFIAKYERRYFFDDVFRTRV